MRSSFWKAGWLWVWFVADLRQVSFFWRGKVFFVADVPRLRWRKRVHFSDGGVSIRYANGSDGFRILKIGGPVLQPYQCSCAHCAADRDCCGNVFCPYVDVGPFGLWSVAHIHVNV